MKCLASLGLLCLAGMVLGGCGQPSTDSPGAATASAPVPANKVVVHYLHRTIRCLTCQRMEAATRQALQESFPSELASGRLELKLEDFQKREDLAKRYGVPTVSVIVVPVVDGRETSVRNLDRIWDLNGRPEEFRAYIAGAVRSALAEVP